MRNQLAPSFELEVFGACARDISVEMDAVRYFRHQGFSEAHRPPVIVVFDQGAVGVAARVRCVVVGAVVVHRPIEELQVRIRAPGVDVEEIGHAEFSDAELDSAGRNGRSEMELVAIGFEALVAERNNLTQH